MDVSFDAASSDAGISHPLDGIPLLIIVVRNECSDMGICHYAFLPFMNEICVRPDSIDRE